MGVISVQVSEEEIVQFKKLAQKMGLSISEMVCKLVLERYKEEVDQITYEDAMVVFRRNPFSFSLEEVEREIGRP